MCVCQFILCNCICKTDRRGLPFCLRNSYCASPVSFRVDSCFGFVMCLYSLFCSGKGKAEFLWVALAHKERRCSLHTDSEPLLCSNMVSKFLREIRTSEGIQGVMLSVRLSFVICSPKEKETSHFNPSVPLTCACPRSKCTDEVSGGHYFQQPVLAWSLPGLRVVARW